MLYYTERIPARYRDGKCSGGLWVKAWDIWQFSFSGHIQSLVWEAGLMRTISKRTQYGLKALLALGEHYREGPMLIATLAKQESIPIKFLEAILLELKGQGVLESKKGKGGGYHLSRPPSTITLGSVIRMMEGPLAPLPCASETAFSPCQECSDIETCGTRMIMRQVRDAMASVLDRTTLADLLQRVAAAKGAVTRVDPGGLDL